MRILTALITIFVLFSSSLLLADELQFPVSCYPKQLQSKFAERGYKIDLSANDRTDDSWGFIESKGNKFSIFTYRAIDPRNLNKIQKIVMED